MTLRAAALLAWVAPLAACLTPARHVVEAPAPPLDGTEMVAVNGAWLRIKDTPAPAMNDGPPVVFVHGLGSRLDAWAPVQKQLATTRRTLSLDQRGFGYSERTAGEYGPEAHTADLVALLDARGIDRAVLVGHSYGGGVVLRTALRHPERVAGIVLVSPFALDEQVVTYLRWAKVPGLGEWIYATQFRDFAGEKYRLAFADADRFVTVPALDEIHRMQAVEGSAWAALATVRGMDYETIEDRYASIKAPVSLVWGEADRVTHFRVAERLLAKLPKGTALVPLPACGHVPSFERPAAVVDAIRALPPALAPASGVALAPTGAP